MSSNTEPIPVGLALRLCEMAIEDCDKATPGPWLFASGYVHGDWPVFSHHVSNSEMRDVFAAPQHNLALLVLSSAVMRPLIENLKGNLQYFWQEETEMIRPGYRSYPPLTALRDFYDKTRPNWRSR